MTASGSATQVATVSQVAANAAAMTDLAAIADVVQSVIVSVAAVVTAVVAVRGIAAWREQLKGSSEYEHAKALMRAVYQTRRAFTIVRSPLMQGYEYPEDMRQGFDVSPEVDAARTLHAYSKRFEALEKAFAALQEEVLEAEVEWGTDTGFRALLNEMWGHVVDVQFAVEWLVDHKRNPSESTSDHLEKANNRSILYELGPDSKYDSFTPKLDETVSHFEKQTRPYIDGSRLKASSPG
jgi:hypothetical protein